MGLFDRFKKQQDESRAELPIAETVLSQQGENTTVGTSGLYQLANAAVGDTLKVAKNGNFWGAFKNAEGTSKLTQLVEAAPLSATSKTVMTINPATMMMAVALFSIEQQLGDIDKMAGRRRNTLETDKSEYEEESNCEI